MAKILVVGLNPAWQKILEFESLNLGRVNRAQRLTKLASGKGLNASLVLRRFGHEVWLLQVLGGLNGQKIAIFGHQRGIHNLTVETTQETHTCATLVDHTSGTVTELIEPFSISTNANTEEHIVGLVRQQGLKFDAALYCGTVPNGLNPGIYYSIHRLTTPAVSILDAVHSIPEELLESVSCVKINRQEFRELEARFPNLFHKDGNPPVFLLTDGANAARILQVSRGRIEEHCFLLPGLDGIINPIGAGDTVTAGVAHHLLAGMSLAEAFRHALAMGSASCLQLRPAEYSEADYERILSRIRAETSPTV
jgi:fructose-1-phosphate kinase PfkB-like protein